MKKRHWVIAGIALLIAVAVTVIGLETNVGGLAPGPLASHFGPGAWYRIGGITRPGQTYAYQGPYVENKTKADAVIDRAVAVGVPRQVHVVKLLTLALPSKRYSAFGGSPYPFSKGPASKFFASVSFPPLHETVVPPGRTIELVFVLAASRSGVYLTKGVWVYYHISSSKYRYFEPAEFALCVLPAKCPSWA